MRLISSLAVLNSALSSFTICLFSLSNYFKVSDYLANPSLALRSQTLSAFNSRFSERSPDICLNSDSYLSYCSDFGGCISTLSSENDSSWPAPYIHDFYSDIDWQMTVYVQIKSVIGLSTNYQILNMQSDQSKVMEQFVDKLCDNLPAERIKLLIDNGFEEWETVTYLQGEQLIELGFNAEECIIVMMSANRNANQHGYPEIFNEEKVNRIVKLAKEKDELIKAEISKEQRKAGYNHKQQALPSSKYIKQYAGKPITEALLLKGTPVKPKQGEKVSLSKITMISLQEKELTHIENMEKVLNVVNLHLGNNHIYSMIGLQSLTKVRVLKLEHNQLRRIEGLDKMVMLQRLFLSNNFIARLENLCNHPNLQSIELSRQRIEGEFTFDPDTMQALGYTLEKLECNDCAIRNITNLKYLTNVRDLSLANNLLEDIGELSETLSGLPRIKSLCFKSNPLAKTQKYRDYIVILSKSLEELDGKKILATEREYLVKLYAIKHAKQSREGKQISSHKKMPEMNLQGVKMEEDYHHHSHNINRATDLRGNVPYANTKHARK